MPRLLSLVVALCLGVAALRAAATLDIYFIDVEGGQATLVVLPSGRTLLIDAGFPGSGTFTSQPGDPHQARDATRIAAAARAAGVSRIDDLLITHFHADHDGGVTELARLMPIGRFIDHGGINPDAESVAGTTEAFHWYEAVRAGAAHLEVKAGDRLPIDGVEATVVSSAGQTIARPLAGAAGKNSACGTSFPAPQEPTENPRSTAVLMQFGRFRLFDPGDLTGTPLAGLVCPNDLIGPVDVYLVAHHGGADAADPSTFAALRPRVAIVGNGPRKGGTPNQLAELRSLTATDTWQLHHTLLAGGVDTDAARVANLEESTSYWLKASAHEDGSFAVTNPRTSASITYPARNGSRQ